MRNQEIHNCIASLELSGSWVIASQQMKKQNKKKHPWNWIKSLIFCSKSEFWHLWHLKISDWIIILFSDWPHLPPVCFYTECIFICPRWCDFASHTQINLRVSAYFVVQVAHWAFFFSKCIYRHMSCCQYNIITLITKKNLFWNFTLGHSLIRRPFNAAPALNHRANR